MRFCCTRGDILGMTPVQSEQNAIDAALASFIERLALHLHSAHVPKLFGSTHEHSRLLVFGLDQNGKPSKGTILRVTVEFGEALEGRELQALIPKAGDGSTPA